MKTHNFHATRAVDIYRGRSGAPIAGTSDIYGSAISGPPSDGNVLVWDGATGTWLVESVGMAPLNTISPAQLTANTDNWNPTGLSTADVIRTSTDASRNLTGITAPSKSRKIVLENVGAQPLVLKHDVTSTAANRLYCPGDTDYTVAKDSAVLLVYDATSSRWRVIDQAAASVPAFATPSIAYGTPAGGAASTVIRSDATIAKPTAADVDFSADVTTNDASTSAHGLLKKLDNTASHYMDGTGGWSVPPGSGAVTFSGCRAFKNGSASFGSGSYLAVPFDSEDWDTDTYHDNSTNNTRFTVPATAKYRVSFGLSHSRSGYFAFIRSNGSASVWTYDFARGSGSANVTSGSFEIALTASDYLELMCNPASGTLSSDGITHFEISRIPGT